MEKIKKLFQCAFEELPVVAEFLIISLIRDMADFNGYSPVFTPSYPEAIREKITVCVTRMRSWTVIQELKATTIQLLEKTEGLRLKLNRVEGYLKLAVHELDVPVASFGVTAVRQMIARGNTEGLLESIPVMLVAVERNFSVLSSKGLTEALIGEFREAVIVIDALNVKQTELESDRNRLTEDNIALFNDLWLSIHPILEAGKAIYRGVSEAKLKDYTMAQLIKRIHHTGKRESKVD